MREENFEIELIGRVLIDSRRTRWILLNGAPSTRWKSILANSALRSSCLRPVAALDQVEALYENGFLRITLAESPAAPDPRCRNDF